MMALAMALAVAMAMAMAMVMIMALALALAMALAMALALAMVMVMIMAVALALAMALAMAMAMAMVMALAMANLKGKNMQPGQSLVSFINESAVLRNKETPRDYLGASSIGHPCSRSIWYDYHVGIKRTFTAKQLRTFSIGKLLEGLIKEQLRLLPIIVHDIPLTLYCQDEDNPIFQGNIDCLIEINGELIVVEIKTAKDSSFKVFVNKGLKLWNIGYYSQVQAYMGMKKINSAYVIVLNKDTSELHDEYVLFDEVFYHELKVKATHIIEASEPPERINKNPMYFICSMCNYKETCHG